SEPAVTRILEKLNPSFDSEIISVLKKDSMEITEKDRQTILDTCSRLDSDKIIITHGTDTMLETAAKLSAIKGKTIVITGAMRPERFANSDAPINIGTAVGAVQVLENGVYIAMHGLVIPWERASRNMETGQYIS
ncbi:MAG: asparaginase, partial [bacterium]|nr:asparaginase [bacterium]